MTKYFIVSVPDPVDQSSVRWDLDALVEGVEQGRAVVTSIDPSIVGDVRDYPADGPDEDDEGRRTSAEESLFWLLWEHVEAVEVE